VANIINLPNKANNVHPNIEINIKDAELYLRLLSGTNNRADFNRHTFVFTGFPDNKKVDKTQRQMLTRQIIGTWEASREELLNMNRLGCGIFVTVNNTDGNGRRNHNITSINTIFVEDDTGTPKDFPIEPSMVIESSVNKFHYYFLTDTLDKLKARAVQEHMVTEYDSDPNAKDLSRVLRIPGFDHLKGDPQKVKLIEAKGQRYSWDDIIKYFPPKTIAPRFQLKSDINQALTMPDEINILTSLSYLDPVFSGDRDGWLKVLMGLHNEFKGQQRGLTIAQEWSRGDYQVDKRYANATPTTYTNDADIEYTWHSMSLNHSDRAPVTIGTVFGMAMKHGFMHNFEPPPFVMSKIPENADDTLKKISRYYAIARTNGGSVRIVCRNTASGHYTFLGKQDFELDISNIRLPMTKQNKQGQTIVEWKAAAPIWLADKETFHYRDMEFEPKSNMYCEEDRARMPDIMPANKTLNQFFGFYVQPIEPQPADLINVKDLVLNVICDGDKQSAEHLHKWIAFTRRYPEKKTGLMITLMGGKGTGKTVMASLVMALHAPFTYTTSNFKSLTGQFNSHYAFTTMVGLEEATWGGREQDNSILKDLITQETTTVNTKYLSVTNESKSCFDIFATANPGFSVPEETRGEERRFWTLSVSDLHKKDKTYFSKFGTVNSPRRQKILTHYAHYLDSLDLTDYDPQNIPSHVGEHSRYNQIESGGDALHFLIALCEDEEIMPIDESDLTTMDLYSSSANRMWNNEDDSISTRMLIPVKIFKQAYTATARFERTSTISAIHIAHEMDQFLPAPHIKQIKAIKKEMDTFSHLTKDGRYLEMANRKHCIAHLESIQLWT